MKNDEGSLRSQASGEVVERVAERLASWGISYVPQRSDDPIYDRLAERVVEDVVTPELERLDKLAGGWWRQSQENGSAYRAAKLRADTHQERADQLVIGLRRLLDRDRKIENGPAPVSESVPAAPEPARDPGFFEEDEPVEDIKAAFDSGIKFVTAPCTSASPIRVGASSPSAGEADTTSRIWGKNATEPADRPQVRDCHGDVWTHVPGTFEWTTPETQNCSWSFIARKFSPLVEVLPNAEQEAGQ